MTAITQSAEHLFRKLGYRKTTVTDIAGQLHMSPANIYQFFPSKRAIAEAVCGRLLSGLEHAAWSIAHQPDSATHRLQTFFTNMHEQAVALFLGHEHVYEILEAATDEQWRAVRRYSDNLDAALSHIVADGIAAGEFVRLDPDRTGKVLHAAMAIFLHPRLVREHLNQGRTVMAGDMSEVIVQALRLDLVTGSHGAQEPSAIMLNVGKAFSP